MDWVGNTEELHGFMLEGAELGAPVVDGTRDLALLPPGTFHLGQTGELGAELVGSPWLFG